MVNYANGKIYKICPISGEDDCYIGSTTQSLSGRMTLHRHTFINISTGPKSKILFDKYGFENCKIILIKKFPCTCKEELHAEEAKHIKNNNCVNKYIPGRTRKEWRKDNKEQVLQKNKQYRQDNKDKIIEINKKYYQDNKEQLVEKQKQYRQVHKEQITEKSKTKYHCICGSMPAIGNKAQHERSTKHIKGEQAFYDGCEQALLELNNK